MDVIQLLTLKPDVEEKVHAHALERYKQWLSEIERESLPEKPTDTDLDTYLSREENEKIVHAAAEIVKWLSHCQGLGEGYSPEPYSVSVVYPMNDIVALVIKTSKKKQEEKRWLAAYKELNPPLQDAQKWLEPKEYKEFEKSIMGAVYAYIDRSNKYILDERSTPYLYYTNTIETRKEEDQVKRKASSKANDYNLFLIEEMARLKSVLLHQKQNLKEYYKSENKDPRNLGYSFKYLLPPDQKQRCEGLIKEKIYQALPTELAEFIGTKITIYFSLLPLAEYSLMGIPCLDLSFEISASVEAEIWINPGKITVDSFVFDLFLMEQPTDHGPYFTVLKEPQLLGYTYVLVNPNDLGRVDWQSIPLKLVLGIMNRETEPQGATITELSDNSTTYEVNGYDDEITIPDRFAEYLQKIGSVQQMVEIGIMGRRVANLLEKKLSEEASRQPELEDDTAGLLPSRTSSSYTAEEFIASLTSLGIPRKDSESLLEQIPKTSTLQDAIKFALKKYAEIVATPVGRNLDDNRLG